MRILRAGIYAVIVFAVLSHGAVEAWARGVVECAAGILLLLWSLTYLPAKRDREIVLPSLLYPLFVLILLVTGQWFLGLTASRFATRIELSLLLSVLILMFVAAQTFRTLSDLRGLAWFVMILGFLVAGLGILQHLTFNGKLYWFREMRYGGIPFGPYVNRNHFAGFAELVLPMSLVPLVTGRVRRERLIIVGIFAGGTLGARVFFASPGGNFSLGGEVAVFLGGVGLGENGSPQHFPGGG